MEGLYSIDDYQNNKVTGDAVIQNVERQRRVANFHDILENRVKALNVRTAKIINGEKYS